MAVRLLSSLADVAAYDRWVKSHPQGTLWQSLEWKGFQNALGNQTRLYVAEGQGRILCSALVVINRTKGNLSAWEVPRGPLCDPNHPEAVVALLAAIEKDAQADRCLALYLSPPLALPHNGEKWQPSNRHMHPDTTRFIDITGGEEEILNAMKPKGRYNIRIAERHGIRIRESLDIDAFVHLLRETGQRDGFRPQADSHYQQFLEHVPGSFLLLAFGSAQGGDHQSLADRQNAQGPVAGLLGVVWGDTGIYYYGASSYEDRSSMAPYLLQWTAMLHCKQQGCTRYDLLGIAPENQPLHPWAGISEFKSKFGGQVVTYPPEQILILRPMTHRLLEMKRKIFG